MAPPSERLKLIWDISNNYSETIEPDEFFQEANGIPYESQTAFASACIVGALKLLLGKVKDNPEMVKLIEMDIVLYETLGNNRGNDDE
tara:strand:+ start:42 stop:305 length:264 start_codon:yes stop_codon:yes gene_type:complete